MPLIDSHCHLQALPPADREAALERARACGVTGFLVPATRLDEADAILELCSRHRDVYCALGVHPHEASSWRSGDAARLGGLLMEADVVAVGECGLDFHYDHSPPDVQERVMTAQWRLALEHDLPVVVHNRDSDDAMLGVLRQPEFAALKADFHSFAGAPEMAAELIEHGLYLGVTGMITFKRADNIRAIARSIPATRLLVETDTPFLSPVPHRGKPNEPAWVVEVATRTAHERGDELEDLLTQTTANFHRLFSRATAEPNRPD
jgi:TatD DNase family protein